MLEKKYVLLIALNNYRDDKHFDTKKYTNIYMYSRINTHCSNLRHTRNYVYIIICYYTDK